MSCINIKNCTPVCFIQFKYAKSIKHCSARALGSYTSIFCNNLQFSNQRTPYSFQTSKILKKSLCDQRLSIGNVPKMITVCGEAYEMDKMTNITHKIESLMSHKLHATPRHPLNHLKQRLVNFLHSRYTNNRGNPIFSVFDNLSPVVTVEQNFDQLLIPKDHISRAKKDNYYINSKYLLRAHTSAHQFELMSSGLNNFVVIGDVYRRDTVDCTHYPVFHQMEGVRLYTPQQLFSDDSTSEAVLTGAPSTDGCPPDDPSPQAAHTPRAVTALTDQLKACLQDMAAHIFGKDNEYRWVSAHFPFTQPSWELELRHNGEWLEVLGCGIIQQRILEEAGVRDRVGFAFGLGLERLAMKLYDVQDIRLFWSRDSGFLSQFDFEDCNKPVKCKLVSNYSPCINDISFWLPNDMAYDENDFYDLVRQVAGDCVEQIKLKDVFTNPKRGLTSHCYRIVYRSMTKVLTQQEVNVMHAAVEKEAIDRLHITVR